MVFLSTKIGHLADMSKKRDEKKRWCLSFNAEWHQRRLFMGAEGAGLLTPTLVATATLLYIVVLYGTLSVLHTGFEFTDAETNRHAVVLLTPADAGRSAEVVGHGLAAIAEIAFAKRIGDIS